MACKTSYELHHNFPKIADEAGFTFNTHRPRIRIDWNKIRLIDVENLIRERKFGLVEQHLNDILDCILESEFDVRILDEGVLKMFRLAQLTVEYQQFCRHYLDRSVYVLREEINSLAQELDVTKKELKDKDDEIRKLKRKSKHTYRTPLPYGNDNIANMILKTLSNKSDFFPTSNTCDTIQYNKCSFCDKVFMNQLYLKSHISRRHSHFMEIPQKDIDESPKLPPPNIENNKLRDEILDLKQKLKEMEDVIKAFSKHDAKNHNNNSSLKETSPVLHVKQMKDAEVSANNEINLLDRIEEWKKEEHDKYNKEIIFLRNQIMETIQSLQTKETPTIQCANSDLKIIEELNTTINKQGSEILALKQELIDSRLKIEKEEIERHKENEVQMLQWANRAESSAKQYEILLHKLNEVAKQAKESRAQAEAERERVAQLEAVLQKNLTEQKANAICENDTKNSSGSIKKLKEFMRQKSMNTKQSFSGPSPEASHHTLEKLHQKAQALLNIQSSSSSSSDVSSVDNNVQQPKIGLHNLRNIGTKNKENISTTSVRKQDKEPYNALKSYNTHQQKMKETKSKKNKSPNAISYNIKVEKNGIIIPPRSPIKVVRAKITEEVNNRLISAGVDPLKSGVPKANYQKQRMKLQQQAEIKAKKNPSHEKIRLSILTYLDSNLPKKVAIEPQDYVSPNKISKAFSIASVISNVKSKALSLVKSNDINDKKNSLNAEVAKRAMSLLNTPPDSVHSSPDSQKRPINTTTTTRTQSENNQKTELKRYNNFTQRKMKVEKNKKRMISSSPQSAIANDDETDSDSNESDHKYYKTVAQETKSIENLIKSPARRPLSANSDYSGTTRKRSIKDDHLLRSQSATNITHVEPDTNIKRITEMENSDRGSTDSSEHVAVEEIAVKQSTVNNIKQTKSVLKNASSTSSLNKKKVLFDMDAIQMKSVSASPSQSITEKSDGNENYELGLINLDGEEWDISSIENEPLKEDTKLQISTKASPKIAELKKTIESQLARRNDTAPTIIVGGVDVMPGPVMRASSMGGSNTSLGSSILDDSESIPPVVNHNSFVKPKTIHTRKDDSELELSEFSADGLFGSKNENDVF